MMNPLLLREAERTTRQRSLDSLKTSDERNRLGQFATPPQLAQAIAHYAFKLYGGTGGVRFLDPAIGTGSFFSAFLHAFTQNHTNVANGIEIDPMFASSARALWGAMGLSVTEGDFTKLQPPHERFNLILTNPPYVRHHHLESSDKLLLANIVRERLGIHVSGLAGLYCYFLLLADAWLASDGLAIWLIPSEFMDVNYGAALKTYLLEKVTLLHIHRFNPLDVQFDDALVSSAVVVFRKRAPLYNHQALFTFGGSLDEPQESQLVGSNELRCSHKWTRFSSKKSVADSPRTNVTLGSLFDIKRGIATGNNEYFILKRAEAKMLGLPESCLRPVLPSPRALPQQIIHSDTDGHPALDHQLVLLDSSLPEEQIQYSFPNLWSYLQQGRSQTIHEGYLASRRKPWYSQEQRPPAPFLCTYMGRSQDKPFRFFLNESKATATNVYLLLYPKEELTEKLVQNPELRTVVFDFFSSIRPSDFFSEARVYGGGLYKLEPAELKRLSADSLIHSLKFSSKSSVSS